MTGQERLRERTRLPVSLPDDSDKGSSRKNMKNRKLGCLIAIISATLYGFMPLFTKTVYASGANAFTAVFLRMTVGTAVFAVMHFLAEKDSLRISRKEFLQLLICSLGYGFTPVLLYTSYQYLDSGLATTLHFVYPVFVVLGSLIFRIEKLSARKIICCVLSMAGIVAFYKPGGEISTAGILIALASGAVYAFYTVYLEASDLLDMGPYKLSFWKHLLSTGIVGIVALAIRQFAWPGSASGWTFAIMLGLLTAVSSFLYQQATRHAGAQSTCLLSTFEPLTSLVVGFFVYNERLEPLNYLGIVCILASVVLLSFGEKKE